MNKHSVSTGVKRENEFVTTFSNIQLYFLRITHIPIPVISLIVFTLRIIMYST